jgi:hypothetical protein
LQSGREPILLRPFRKSPCQDVEEPGATADDSATTPANTATIVRSGCNMATPFLRDAK